MYSHFWEAFANGGDDTESRPQYWANGARCSLERKDFINFKNSTILGTRAPDSVGNVVETPLILVHFGLMAECKIFHRSGGEGQYKQVSFLPFMGEDERCLSFLGTVAEETQLGVPSFGVKVGDQRYEALVSRTLPASRAPSTPQTPKSKGKAPSWQASKWH